MPKHQTAALHSASPTRTRAVGLSSYTHTAFDSDPELQLEAHVPCPLSLNSSGVSDCALPEPEAKRQRRSTPLGECAKRVGVEHKLKSYDGLSGKELKAAQTANQQVVARAEQQQASANESKSKPKAAVSKGKGSSSTTSGRKVICTSDAVEPDPGQYGGGTNAETSESEESGGESEGESSGEESEGEESPGKDMHVWPWVGLQQLHAEHDLDFCPGLPFCRQGFRCPACGPSWW